MVEYFSGSGAGLSNAIVEQNYKCKYPLASCNPIDCENRPHIIDASELIDHKALIDLSECPPDCFFQINLENTIADKTYTYSTPNGSVIVEGTEHFPYVSAGADVHQKFKITSGFNTELEIFDGDYSYGNSDKAYADPYIVGDLPPTEQVDLDYEADVGSGTPFIGFSVNVLEGYSYNCSLATGAMQGLQANDTGAVWGVNFTALKTGTVIFMTRSLQPAGFTVTFRVNYSV